MSQLTKSSNAKHCLVSSIYEIFSMIRGNKKKNVFTVVVTSSHKENMAWIAISKSNIKLMLCCVFPLNLYNLRFWLLTSCTIDCHCHLNSSTLFPWNMCLDKMLQLFPLLMSLRECPFSKRNAVDRKNSVYRRPYLILLN